MIIDLTPLCLWRQTVQFLSAFLYFEVSLWNVTGSLNFSLFNRMSEDSWGFRIQQLTAWQIWRFFTCFTAARASRPRSWLQTDSGGNSHKIGHIETERERGNCTSSSIQQSPLWVKESGEDLPLSTFRVIKVNQVFLNPLSWSNEFLLMTAITAWACQILFQIFYLPSWAF